MIVLNLSSDIKYHLEIGSRILIKFIRNYFKNTGSDFHIQLFTCKVRILYLAHVLLQCT